MKKRDETKGIVASRPNGGEGGLTPADNPSEGGPAANNRGACAVRWRGPGDKGWARPCVLAAGHAGDHDDGRSCGAPGPTGPCVRHERHAPPHARPGSLWVGATEAYRDETTPPPVTRELLAELLERAHAAADEAARAAGVLAFDGEEPDAADLSEQIASLAGALLDAATTVRVFAGREAGLAAEGFGGAAGLRGRPECAAPNPMDPRAPCRQPKEHAGRHAAGAYSWGQSDDGGVSRCERGHRLDAADVAHGSCPGCLAEEEAHPCEHGTEHDDCEACLEYVGGLPDHASDRAGRIREAARTGAAVNRGPYTREDE